MKVGTFAMCVLCAASMLGCSRTDTLPADVTGALEQAITRHDLAASVALFADDAQILPQHGPAVRGRQEIEAYLNDWIDSQGHVRHGHGDDARARRSRRRARPLSYPQRSPRLRRRGRQVPARLAPCRQRLEAVPAHLQHRRRASHRRSRSSPLARKVRRSIMTNSSVQSLSRSRARRRSRRRWHEVAARSTQ